jgi:hypothetical protein
MSGSGKAQSIVDEKQKAKMKELWPKPPESTILSPCVQGETSNCTWST